MLPTLFVVAAAARAAVLHNLQCTAGQLSTSEIPGSRRFHSTSWTARAASRETLFFTFSGGYSSRHRRVSRSLYTKFHIVATSLLLSVGPASPVMCSTKILPQPPPDSSGYQTFQLYWWATRRIDSLHSQAARKRNCFLSEVCMCSPCLALPCLALPCLALPCLAFPLNTTPTGRHILSAERVHSVHSVHSVHRYLKRATSDLRFVVDPCCTATMTQIQCTLIRTRVDRKRKCSSCEGAEAEGMSCIYIVSIYIPFMYTNNNRYHTYDV